MVSVSSISGLSCALTNTLILICDVIACIELEEQNAEGIVRLLYCYIVRKYNY